MGLHMIKLHRTKCMHMCACTFTHTHKSYIYKPGKIWRRWVNYINGNFLVLIMYCSCARCYHWGKPDEWHTGYLSIVFLCCNHMWIYNDLKIKNIFLKSRWGAQIWPSAPRDKPGKQRGATGGALSHLQMEKSTLNVAPLSRVFILGDQSQSMLVCVFMEREKKKQFK